MRDDYQITPNPDLGQHFIQDEKYSEMMASLLAKNSVVIEVGPGMGSLTEVLAKKVKRVIAIEIDKRFQKHLEQILRRYKNIEIVFADALSSEFDRIVTHNRRGNDHLFVVSNLPYQITEPFIRKLALLNLQAILMVGKKFGYQSQINDPKDEKFTELSYICRSFFYIEKIIEVPKSAFLPIPKTDSVILRLIPKDKISDTDFISQKVIKTQKNGGLVKNVLMEGFVGLKASRGKKMTKNAARDIVKTLNLRKDILDKSFSQLDNNEVRTLAASLDRVSLTK